MLRRLLELLRKFLYSLSFSLIFFCICMGKGRYAE